MLNPRGSQCHLNLKKIYAGAAGDQCRASLLLGLLLGDSGATAPARVERSRGTSWHFILCLINSFSLFHFQSLRKSQ